MGDIELYNDDEVPALIAAARWTAKRSGDPGMMRLRLHQSQRVVPVWTTVEADRDGTPKVQVWRLPRLRWPGLSVWREAGKYSVWAQCSRSDTYTPTGCEFSTLRELSEYLHSVAIM